MKTAQSSLEFLIIIALIFLISIYVMSELTGVTRTTIAMAAAKESFYEKTLQLDQTVEVKKIEFLRCEDELSLNFQTNNISAGTQTQLENNLETVETETKQVSGMAEVCIEVNSGTFPSNCPAVPPGLCP